MGVQHEITDHIAAVLNASTLPPESAADKVSLGLHLLVSAEHRASVKALADSVAGQFDQVVAVVDAGDAKTAAAAKAAFNGCRVIEREGVGDDLGAARNAAFEAGQCRWRMFLDADETFPDVAQLRAVLAHLDRTQPGVSCVWLQGRYADVVDECRIRVLRWADGWKWIRRAHEEPVLPGRTRSGVVVADLWTIHHIDVAARAAGKHLGRPRVEKAFGLALAEGKQHEAGTLSYHLGLYNFADATKLQQGTEERAKLEELAAQHLTFCAEAIPGTSTASHALVCLSRLRLGQAHYDKAADAAGRAVAMAPSLLDAHLALGLAKLASESNAEAALAFDLAEGVVRSERRTAAMIRGHLDLNFEATGWAGAAVAYIGTSRPIEHARRALGRIPARADQGGNVARARAVVDHVEALQAATGYANYLVSCGEPAKAITVLSQAVPAILEDDPIVAQATRLLEKRLEDSNLCSIEDAEDGDELASSLRGWAKNASEPLEFDLPTQKFSSPTATPPAIFGQARHWGPAELWRAIRWAWLDGRLEERNGHYKAILRKRTPTLVSHLWTRRVTFFIPDTPESFDPDTPGQRHLMGSEEAVLELAQALAARGWEVTIHSPRPARRDDVVVHAQDGVLYRGNNSVDLLADHGVLVVWRAPQFFMSPEFRAGPSRKVMMLQDHRYGAPAEAFTHADAVVVRSAAHVLQLAADGLKPDAPNIYVAPDGLDDVTLFQELREADEAQRDQKKVLYCSSPDRGLVGLLDAWPKVRAAVPDATLEITYSWSSFIRAAPEAAKLLRQRVLEMASLGVTLHGGLPAPALARLMHESGVWAMPCTWPEVSCMAAAKAMAAGCEPVTSDELITGLTETLRACHARAPVKPADFAVTLIEALKEPAFFDTRKLWSDSARVRHGWRSAAAPAFERALFRS